MSRLAAAGPVVRPDGVDELLDLGGVEEQHLALDPLGQPHPGGRVAGQPATLPLAGFTERDCELAARSGLLAGIIACPVVEQRSGPLSGAVALARLQELKGRLQDARLRAAGGLYAGEVPSPNPFRGLCEVALPGHLVDVAPYVLTVLDYAGGLLCRAKDRKHAGNLAGVAEGRAEHPGWRVLGRHGQLVEAAAALALRRDRATARVVQVHHARQLLLLPAPCWTYGSRARGAGGLLLRRLGLADGTGPASVRLPRP